MLGNTSDLTAFLILFILNHQVLADIATNEKEPASDKAFFPPEEMDEEEEERSNKKNSAQKRQDQRDARRYKENPDRSQREEDNERQRKYSQSQRRGRDRADPNDPNHGNRDYARNRDARRSSQCNRSECGICHFFLCGSNVLRKLTVISMCHDVFIYTDGRGCDYDRDNTREPNRRRREADRDCYRGCNGRSSCNRRCDALENVEDVEYIADILLDEDVPFIAKFFSEAFDKDDLEHFYDDVDVQDD